MDETPLEILKERLKDPEQMHCVSGEFVTHDHPACDLLVGDQVFENFDGEGNIGVFK